MSSLASSATPSSQAAGTHAAPGPSPSLRQVLGAAGDLCVFAVSGLHGPCFVLTEGSGEREAEGESAIKEGTGGRPGNVWGWGTPEHEHCQLGQRTQSQAQLRGSLQCTYVTHILHRILSVEKPTGRAVYPSLSMSFAIWAAPGKHRLEAGQDTALSNMTCPLRSACSPLPCISSRNRRDAHHNVWKRSYWE